MIATTGGRPAEKRRPQQLIEQMRGLPAVERVAALEVELKASVLERELLLLDGLSVSYGGGSQDFSLEDPANDSGDGVWDEVGFRGGSNLSGLPRLRSMWDLTKARNTARVLAESNSVAIGAHETRQNYYVGHGLMWRAVPKDPKSEHKDLTAKVNAAIEEFCKANNWPAMERESVLRRDRDGEWFHRTYVNAFGPLRVRFVSPEYVLAPSSAGGVEEQARVAFGVEVDDDPTKPVAFWILEGASTEPTRVSAMVEGLGIPQVVHHKANVDSDVRRGWPTMEPIARNLSRMEKLLRNMSYVAALQAAIALIKRYDATESQVAAHLLANADLVTTNTTTGKAMTQLKMNPGTIVNAPKGVSYEAPIQNANPERFVAVYQADARAASVRLNMPEYMFTGDSSNAAYASQLVAESPFVKHVESTQWGVLHHPFLEIMHAALVHEEFWGRLPAGTVERYTLLCEFPNPIVRAQLEEAQKGQILKAAGALSVQTMRAQFGLEDTIEEQNFDEMVKRGYPDPRKSAVAPPTDKPPPGSTPGGPGGEDQIDPEDPSKTRKADVSESRRGHLVIEVQQPAAAPPAPPPAPLPAPNVHVFMEAPAAAAPVVVPAPQVTAVIQTPEQATPVVNVTVNTPQQAPPVVHVHAPAVPTVKKRGRMVKTADGKGWDFVAEETPAE